MNRRNHLALALAVCAFGLGISPGEAQTAAPATGKGNGKVAACRPNLARCTNNDARWQAAIKNHDRRADDYRKNPGRAKGHH